MINNMNVQPLITPIFRGFKTGKIYFSIVVLVALGCQMRENTTGNETKPVVSESAPPSTEVAIAPDEPPTAPGEDFTTDYLMGKFDPAQHPEFTLIAQKHASRSDMYLRKDAYDAFIRMQDAAKQEGIRLLIISATRNFDRQKQIWEAKWTGAQPVGGQNIAKTIEDPVKRALKILEYSSMPGSSRHHWGTDIDLNDLNDAHFQTPEGRKVYEWLRAHAAEYGYCQPYSPQGKDRPHGYHEEKWHWSYMPVSKTLTEQARKTLKDELISGFKGAETATSIGVVKKYVLGINRECVD